MPYQVSSPLVDFTVHPRFLLEAEYKDNIPPITKEMAVSIVKTRLDIQRGMQCRLLLHMEKFLQITGPARKYFEEEGSEKIAATAILVNSWTMKFVMKFILGIKKPKFTTEVFTDRNQAIDWLMKQDIGESDMGTSLIPRGLQLFDHVIGVDHYPKLTYDHHRVINKVNDAFCRMTGYTEAELLGQPFAKVSNDGKELFDRQSRLLRVSLEVSQCPVGRDGWCDSLVCVVLPERSRTDLATLGMTPQDLVMIQYLTAGMTVGKAAIKMEVPQRTIEGRILQIRKKLEAKNIAQLIQKLNDLGVLGD